MHMALLRSSNIYLDLANPLMRVVALNCSRFCIHHHTYKPIQTINQRHSYIALTIEHASPRTKSGVLFEYRIYFRRKRGIIVQQGRKETT